MVEFNCKTVMEPVVRALKKDQIKLSPPEIIHKNRKDTELLDHADTSSNIDDSPTYKLFSAALLSCPNKNSKLITLQKNRKEFQPKVLDSIKKTDGKLSPLTSYSVSHNVAGKSYSDWNTTEKDEKKIDCKVSSNIMSQETRRKSRLGTLKKSFKQDGISNMFDGLHLAPSTPQQTGRESKLGTPYWKLQKEITPIQIPQKVGHVNNNLPSSFPWFPHSEPARKSKLGTPRSRVQRETVSRILNNVANVNNNLPSSSLYFPHDESARKSQLGTLQKFHKDVASAKPNDNIAKKNYSDDLPWGLQGDRTKNKLKTPQKYGIQIALQNLNNIVHGNSELTSPFPWFPHEIKRKSQLGTPRKGPSYVEEGLVLSLIGWIVLIGIKSDFWKQYWTRQCLI